ncbi:MAG: aminotransferase class IV [Halobacteriales archaeon]|nr:aminotransferase class IV [Halobacteriales archaeon]
MTDTKRDDLGDETHVLVENGGEREVGKPDDVRISTLDRGFLYGDAVFETLRCYDGAPAFLKRHVSRLDDALGATGIDASFDVSSVEERVSVVTDGFAGDAYVRLTVTRGGRDGLLAPTEKDATVVVHAKPLESRRYPPAKVETATEPRPIGVLERHKTGCYLPNVVAKGETSVEADEALMLADGNVASGAVSNVFVVRDGTVETPEARIRKGVTREVVLETADEKGYETHVGETSLESTDAVFLTNTTWGVRPVESIDGRGYDAEHPVVEELADAYLERALADSDADNVRR